MHEYTTVQSIITNQRNRFHGDACTLQLSNGQKTFVFKKIDYHEDTNVQQYKTMIESLHPAEIEHMITLELIQNQYHLPDNNNDYCLWRFT